MPRSLVLSVSFALLFGLATVVPSRGEAPAGSVDDELIRLGREIPGFGGLYYDEQGRPNVYLLDPEGPGRRALKRLGAEVLVHQGDYEIGRLLDWRRELRPVLALAGVVFLDVDEARNRIVIGLDASSPGLDRERFERELLSTGVPRQAVLLKETGRIELLAGLQDKLRPTPGGAQVVFSSFICTLGFSAFRGRDFGFVINSHCTDALGEVEGTRYFQSVPAKDTSIGAEIADPGFFVDPPCPPGRRCRFSDSAFAKYDNPRLGGLGKIARPVSGGSDAGSTILKNPSARFTLTGRAGAPFVGEVVHKIGRTTGWTYGAVIGTCVDVNLNEELTLLCQSGVQLGGGPGDSGAPVFTVLPGNKARLVGILWGGGIDPDLGIVGIFSPLENIEADLGTLKVN
jgi:hypothetical protein